MPKDEKIKSLEQEAYNLIVGTETFLNANLDGIIIGCPIARLDFSIYIFFEIYCSLCSAGHKKLLDHFSDIFIEKLTKFYNTVYRLDIDFIGTIFNNRIDQYENTIANNPKNPDFLKDIIHFIKNDIHDEPLSESTIIESIDKHLQIYIEVTSIYEAAIKSMMPTIRELHRLNA